jgi:hypothetical protein
MAMPDQFTEIAFVAISDESGNEYQFGTIVDTIDIAWGARDIESIATVSAGRVTKFIPEEVSEITLELFPVGITSDGTTPNGIHAWFMGMTPNTTSGTNSFSRKKFRVAVLWSTLSTAPSNAAGALDSADHLRFSFWSCYLTQATADFTDDILKATVTFKCPPYDRAGNPLIKAEEADNGTLASLNTFGSGGSYKP